MKNFQLRSVIVLFFITASFGSAIAQSITPTFKGSAADVKAAVQANTLSFFVSGLDNEQQVADFIKKSTPYSKGFTMTIPSSDAKVRECKIKFTGTPDMKWLQRFFMASGITSVVLNNNSMSTDSFFKLLQ